jgi:MoaA/NifB/PqqE/SkfB family radical SAM enzyme
LEIAFSAIARSNNINALIINYRKLSLSMQRSVAIMLYAFVNNPIMGVLYHFVYLRRIKGKLKKFPTTLIIESSNYCNLKCVMCPYKVMTREKCTMSMSLYRKIIDDAASMSMTEVAISGYLEPLLDKFLYERINYAKFKGLRVGFSSNGTLLLKNDNITQILDSKLDWIAFSVDGATKETYEKIRIGARFENVVNGVSKLVQKKAEMHLATPEIHINCCVQADNYDEIKTQRKKLYEILKGADILEFGTVSLRGGESKRLTRELDFETPRKNRRRNYPCFSLFNCIYCLADGTIALCCIDYDGHFRLGDLNIQTLVEIWKLEQYQKIRQLHIEGRGAEINICSNCKEFELSTFKWWM